MFLKLTIGCITCNKALWEGIYNSTFFPNLVVMLSAFIVLALIILVLARFTSAQHKPLVPLTSSAVILGIGLGGFADGIILHQLLQWHEMLSYKIPITTYTGKSINMFWDGIFHFFTLCVTLTGIILLWRLSKRNDINKSGLLFGGGLIFGWGLFNIVEGVIDHHLLKLHNVKEVSINPDAWNIGFLLFSVILMISGSMLIRHASKKKAPNFIIKV